MIPASHCRLAAFVLALLACAAPAAWAQAIPLGSAANFGVLGSSTVTNTGPTVVTGDVGVSPNNAIVGFPPGIVIGTLHAGDAVAAQARTDAIAAYTALQALPCQVDLTGQNLGGLVLTPGVYCFTTSAQLTGVLTLNGLGNPNAQFVFQVGSTLTTASNSAVLLINAAQACNAGWAIGSSATLGTNTVFAGNVLATNSVTLNTGAALFGPAIGLNGAVTLDSNTVTACQSAQVAAGAAAIPVLGDSVLLLLAFLVFGAGLASIMTHSPRN